jgi:hypothetical protein
VRSLIVYAFPRLGAFPRVSCILQPALFIIVCVAPQFCEPLIVYAFVLLPNFPVSFALQSLLTLAVCAFLLPDLPILIFSFIRLASIALAFFFPKLISLPLLA